MNLKQKFERHVITIPFHSCWEWVGKRDRKNDRERYGKMLVDGKERYAHRLSYEIFVGPIPSGFYICHRCDNPGCVRPDHLFLGTPTENNHDMMHKGRFRGGRKKKLTNPAA